MEQSQEKNFKNKALSTAYKIRGWNLRLKAIGSAIFGLFVFIGGIIIAISTKTWGSLIFSIIGIVVLIGSWIYWKRAKSADEGKFY
ncbi:hypothetical protein HN903_01350 [archaeon]|nr:hypothetical protein [archaeon]MBT7128378.1 hypothetical protein [archaeon]